MKEINQKAEYIDIKLLKPHPKNPRIIKDDQFKKLCASIQGSPEYFETRPILCNKEYIVFAGNMRLKASQELGLEFVPAVIMDISEEKQREIMIRDNRQNGEWDWEMLTENFDIPELKDFGFDDWEFGTEEALEAPTIDASKFDEWNDAYEKGTVKQIVLYFPGGEFSGIMDRLQAAMKHAVLKDNSEMFLKMLELYENEMALEGGQDSGTLPEDDDNSELMANDYE